MRHYREMGIAQKKIVNFVHSWKNKNYDKSG
jgi:hypothetical protein